jgi:hypothetical protein
MEKTEKSLARLRFFLKEDSKSEIKMETLQWMSQK